ncbi:hypothetical protein D3C71_1318430 [compost metagenome]
MVAQQVDDRLYSLADAHDAGSQRIARDVATEAAQQYGRSVQWHAELVLAGDDPGLGLLGEQPARDDARRRRCNLQALIAAGTGVLDAVVLQHAHLFGDDIHLLADLGADLHQRVPVMRAHTLGLGQFVAHDLARQRRVQRLASAFLTLMARDRCQRLFVDVFDLGLRRLICGRECLGLVEEQVLLIRAAGFALGSEQLALQRPQSFQCEVPLGGGDSKRTGQRIALGNERGEFFSGDGGGRRHARLDRHAPSLFLQATLQ